MKTYTTSEVAGIIGVHPNTVRLYEELNLLPPVPRNSNGYRVFTRRHIDQFRLARTAFQVEILQNGLRRLMIEIVKVSATGDFDRALVLTGQYLDQLSHERNHALEAIAITEHLLADDPPFSVQRTFTRKEAADHLEITIDTLRNWELNGLLTVKRKENGYRVYNLKDMERLKIIRSLRCANYSLSAILRMLHSLSADSTANIADALNASQNDDILTACDHLLGSIDHAVENALHIQALLKEMKKNYLLM